MTQPEEIVQFLWRSPKVGDAGIVIGGTPNNPLKKIDLFFVVLEVQPQTLDSHYDVKHVCLVTDRVRQNTTKEILSIQYFITAERPVQDLFSENGLHKLKSMLGTFAIRYLVDYKIIA